jgi:hypothetical protein
MENMTGPTGAAVRVESYRRVLPSLPSQVPMDLSSIIILVQGEVTSICHLLSMALNLTPASGNSEENRVAEVTERCAFQLYSLRVLHYLFVLVTVVSQPSRSSPGVSPSARCASSPR